MGFRIFFMKFSVDEKPAAIVDEVVCDRYEETVVGVKLFKLDPMLPTGLPLLVYPTREPSGWWERTFGVPEDRWGWLALNEENDRRLRVERERVAHFVTVSNQSFDYYKVFRFEGAAP